MSQHSCLTSASLPSPQFLYALPQKEGYEFFVGQWSGHELHFTSLINVQVNHFAQPLHMLLRKFDAVWASNSTAVK